MPPKGFVLWFTGPRSATRTTIANLTGHELKQRGYNIEPLVGQSSVTDWISVLNNSKADEDDYTQQLRRVCASGISNEGIVLAALKSEVPRTLEDLRCSVEAFVEVETGAPNHEQGDESQNLNFTKIFLQPDAEPEQCVVDIVAKLEDLKLIVAPAPENSSYDEDDEATIRSRLEALGYL